MVSAMTRSFNLSIANGLTATQLALSRPEDEAYSGLKGLCKALPEIAALAIE